jgi:hypothetical protein
MRNIEFALAATLLLAPAANAAPCDLAKMSWMVGAWRNDTEDAKSEERWVWGPGGQLMGSSWALHPTHPGGLVEIETLLADPDGQVRLRVRHFGFALDHPWEAPEAPMSFVATDCGRETIDLAGEGAHAGERIRYSRNGDTLTFTGDFLHAGKPAKVVITLYREHAGLSGHRPLRFIVEDRGQPAFGDGGGPALAAGVVLGLVALNLADAEIVRLRVGEVEAGNGGGRVHREAVS